MFGIKQGIKLIADRYTIYKCFLFI